MSAGLSREELEHVYGSLDEEVGEYLDNVSSTDPSVADDAVIGLIELLVGGGVVGRITLPAVPHLVDLVAPGVGDTAGLLMLLGSIAGTDDEVDIPEGSACATVANELPRMMPMLEHPDPEVRRQAVWAVAQCRRPDATLGTLLARWEVEPKLAVRADLLFAYALLDPRQAAPLVSAGQDPSEANAVRMAALFTGLDVGLPWTTESSGSMLSLLQAGERLDGCTWIDRFERPLQALVERLWVHGRADAAVELLAMAVNTDFGEHKADLLVAVREALDLDEGDRGPGGVTSRTHVLRALLDEARDG
ncbi:hypothetical protein [Promicromonospora soli]